MSTPIRLGLVGTARINDQLLGGVQETDAVEVVAVGSRDPDRGIEYARRQGIPIAHPSYEALLADPNVDAVYVAVPNSLHHELTLQSLRAGKHVLVEKPYSADPRDVDEAYDLAEREGLVLIEALMWRYGPGARKIAELLPSVGEVVTIQAAFSFRLETTGDVRLDGSLAGGSLMDVGCYSISGARLAAGAEPVRVFGSAFWAESGVDRRFHGQLEFGSGAVAHISSGFDMNQSGIAITGTAGSFSLSDPWRGETTDGELNGKSFSYESENQYRLELEDLAAAIRGTRAPLLGRANSLGQARTIEALYRSARTGAVVEL